MGDLLPVFIMLVTLLPSLGTTLYISRVKPGANSHDITHSDPEFVRLKEEARRELDLLDGTILPSDVPRRTTVMAGPNEPARVEIEAWDGSVSVEYFDPIEIVSFDSEEPSYVRGTQNGGPR